MTQFKSTTVVIDSASEMAKVLLLQGDDVVGERKWENEPGVGTRLLKEIEGLLKENELKMGDIGAVAVNVVAKKWFSSARAGVAVANGLAVAHEVKLYELGGVEDKKIANGLSSAIEVGVAKLSYGG